MQFLTFQEGKDDKLGVVDLQRGVLDLVACDRQLAASHFASLETLIQSGSEGLEAAKTAIEGARHDPAAPWRPLEDIKHRAPIPRPRKNIFCVGMNYREHIIEMANARGREVTFPECPSFFSKAPTTVIGHNEVVERHARNTTALDYEVELAVVIGKTCRDLDASNARSAIFGYTVVNDITARDAQQAHGQFFKGKSFDRSCPIGPVVVTPDEFGEPSGHELTLRVNGKTRQHSNTSDMLFSVDEILIALSASLTLEPGDIVATGTPQGVAQGMKPPAFLQVGDIVEAEVEGIGVLRNVIVA